MDSSRTEEKTTGIEKKHVTSIGEGDISFINGPEELEKSLRNNSQRVFIMMCRTGRMQIELDGRMFKVGKSNIMFILPNSNVTNMMFSADVKCGAICLHSMRVGSFLRAHDLLNLLLAIRKHPLLHISDDLAANLLKLREASNFALTMQSSYFEQVMSHLNDIFMYCLFGYYRDYIERVIPKEAAGPNRKNQLFLEFMKHLQHSKGTVREVNYYADLLAVSPKYLTTLCKEVSNRSCSQWITEIVTDEIRHLLRYTDLSIKEIATRLNFNNYSFFSKYVKKNIGCTPMHYRQRFRSDR